jgi:DNA-binding NtrC family response regulator
MGKQTDRSVLVVEDEIDLRTLLEDLVREAGFRVTTAEDGAAAIALLKKNTFDLALLDIQMPNASGIDVLRHIRQHSPATKAIMLTGYADLKHAMEAREFGALDFISKPYKLDDVLQTINRVLGT